MNIEKWLDMETHLYTIMQHNLLMDRWKPLTDLSEWDVLEQDWVFEIAFDRIVPYPWSLWK